MAADFALLAVDGRVVEHVNADFVVVPRGVRRVLEMPGGLAGIDVERHRRVGVEVVPGARLRIVDRERVARADDVEAGWRGGGGGLSGFAAPGFSPIVGVFSSLAGPGARLGGGGPP